MVLSKDISSIEQASTVSILLYPFVDQEQLTSYFMNQISLLIAPYYKENSADHAIQFDLVTLVRDEEAFNQAMNAIAFMLAYVFCRYQYSV